MSNLVVYHANCCDGFTAAWVANGALKGSTEFVPCQYGDGPPDCKNRDVYVLDFSFPRETMERMNTEARTLVVLDHHKTAERNLIGLPFAIFDMTKSGARMAWEYFYHPTASCPSLVDFTEDRDLWRWNLLYSREINAVIGSYPHEMELWDFLEAQLNDGMLRLALIAQGEAILRYQKQIVDGAVQKAREVVIAGHCVPCVNATVCFSEIAGALAEGKPFGAVWFQREDGLFVYSLRSRGDGLDVSEIARQYGGGGHKQASGFQVKKILE